MGKLPFQAGGEAGTAASAEAGSLDHVDYFLLRHFGQHLAQRRICVSCNSLFDILGIDNTAISQRDSFLFLIELHFVQRFHAGFVLVDGFAM